MKNNFRNIIHKYRLIITILLFCLPIQFALFNSSGIRFGGDTGRYIYGANQIISGHLIPGGMANAYLGYDYYVALIYFLHLGNIGVITGQVLFSIVCAYCLYRLTFLVGKSKFAATFATIFYIFATDIHNWNFFVLSDSLFTSMTVISLYLVARTKNVKQLFCIVPIVFWTSTIRPMGFVLLISVLIYGIYKLRKYNKYRLYVNALVALLVLSLPIWLLAIDKMVVHMTVVDTFLKGKIIWGDDKLVITIPASIHMNAQTNQNSLPGIIFFIMNNFTYVAKLAIIKLYYFILHTKPFYLTQRNHWIIYTYYPIYLLGYIWFNKSKFSANSALLCLYLVGQTMIVMMTFEDWDGRFLDDIIPVFYVFAGMGLTYIINLYTPIKQLEKKVFDQTFQSNSPSSKPS
ncbi:MAG: hypothetical protein Q7S57_00365 [bacterium]|nr:hypothetical protein [bacterium]